MFRLLLILCCTLRFAAIAQNRDEFSVASYDTLKSFLLPKNPPFLYDARINRRESSIWNKVVRGSIYVSTYNVIIGTELILSSERITKWYKKDKFSIPAITGQYKTSFTTAPVIDKDLFIINYLGHPYQGAYYYNCLRSQGASEWQSALFSALHSTLWEYVWEGGVEQPSIQDIIVTPITGALLGELSHVLTVKMSRNGFQWYEKVIVCIINPAYAVNNGFRTKKNNIIY
jgi:Domain of unknown function (DUF3943)